MSARFEQSARPARGLALIAVTWVIVIASLILMGAKRAARVNLAAAYGGLASVQAHWLARAGIEQAIAMLEDDYANVDSDLDDWYEEPTCFEEVELTGGKFSVSAPAAEGDEPSLQRFGLIDHAARVNVNTADEKQLSKLLDLESWQVNAIVDWRDKDDSARVGGAEGGYYRHLDFPYEIRNDPFQTLHELLLVRRIDEPTFYGEDANLNGLLDANEDDRGGSVPPDDGDGQLQLGLAGLTTIYSYELNQDASGSDRLNVNSADKQALTRQLNLSDALAEGIVEAGKKKKFGKLVELLDVKPKQGRASRSGQGQGEERVNKITVKWLAENLDGLTVTDEERLPGRINVNTAGRDVLRTLPEINKDTAESIIDRRASPAGPFGSVGELFTSKTISEKQFKALAHCVSVRSSVFEIHSSARTKWGMRHKIVAVVDRGAQPMTILYWYQSE